jgi:AraC family transcriptional regulator of adaptative response/methylated-DNA-[protein]-cysteine methyltransferase
MNDTINYERVEKAIRYLASHVQDQPTLEEVARHCHVSPYHFQRIFTEWAGISPKKFLQYLTVRELKEELRSAGSVLDAADRAGLSAQSRVHDHFVTIEAVTPGEYASKGDGIEIVYGYHDTPFGKCCIALTERGICSVAFAGRSESASHLSEDWARARVRRSDRETEGAARALFSGGAKADRRTLLVRGTKFQIKVWEALIRIPFGHVAGYRDIAAAIGSSGAVRAVGSAVASNPIAYLIPCHRVIRSEGKIGEYHWGAERKLAMIGWEKARAHGLERNVA